MGGDKACGELVGEVPTFHCAWEELAPATGRAEVSGDTSPSPGSKQKRFGLVRTRYPGAWLWQLELHAW